MKELTSNNQDLLGRSALTLLNIVVNKATGLGDSLGAKISSGIDSLWGVKNN